MLDQELLEERSFRGPWRALALFLIAMLMLGTGAYAYHARSQAAAAPTFATIAVSRGDLAVGVSATGPVSTAASIPLTFKNSGLLSEVLVKPGDHVQAGQLLAREDAADLQHAVDQAQAAVEQQTANLQKLRQGPTPAAIAVAQAGVDNAKRALADAQQQVTTVQQSNAADLASAQHAVDTAQAALADAQRTAVTTQAQLAAGAKSDATAVANAQTALDAARANLANVQQQVATSTASDRTAVANAQAALADAQHSQDLAVTGARQALANAQQASQAAAATQAQQIAKAKNDLNAVQISRDAVCGQVGHSGSQAQCDAANAQVNAAQTAIDQAGAAAQQAAVQAQQAITTAQQQVAQTQSGDDVHKAEATLKTAQDALNANLAKYQGNVSAAQAQVSQTTGALQVVRDTRASDAAKAQQTLASEQQQVDQAAAALKTAQDAYGKAQAQAAANLRQAQQQVDQAQGQLQSAEANLQQVSTPPTQAELDAAKAQVDQAEAALATAQGNLDAATLRSPIAATVAQVNDIAGQYITGGSAGTSSSTSSNASATAFIVLTDLQALQVVAQVNEADMAKVAPGQPVQFTLNAFPGQNFTGKVAAIQPLGSSSNNVVSYNVTCSIDPTTTKLLPGMTANVTIVTDHRTNVLLVPAAALSFAQPAASNSNAPAMATSGLNNATLLVLQNGHPVRRPAQTGLSDGSRTEIVSGVQPGEQVIVAAR